MSRKDTSSIHFLEREFVKMLSKWYLVVSFHQQISVKMLAPNRVIAEVYVSVFPAACVAPWGAGIVSSWAGIQHHLHNDNPVLEYLRRGGFWFWCINPWKPNSHPDWDLWAWLCVFVSLSNFLFFVCQILCCISINMYLSLGLPHQKKGSWNGWKTHIWDEFGAYK